MSESWSDEDEAAFHLESLPAWHPSLFVDVFHTALTVPETHASYRILSEAMVTPESVESWGDFSRARTVLAGLRISMTPLAAEGAPDVAYVRLVETDQHLVRMADTPASMHVTLVWRPEIAIVPDTGWRIHAIGEPVAPHLLTRTAPGFDPSAP
ncbi:hypothetical protein ACOKGD_13895 [Microbacterium phosphatis]|uniref:hypothetical protein n=1 Tax=Microbacterium phosphatis TaxID=3140248 RepID=UPI00313FF65E